LPTPGFHPTVGYRVSGLTSPRGVDAGVINGDGPGDAKEGGGERLGLTRVGWLKNHRHWPRYLLA